jgi:predicted enzyme related to lactoylglutathione lyase
MTGMSESDQQGQRPATPVVSLDVVALDTDEPRRLADFYASLLGWQVDRADEDWVEIHPPAPGSGVAGLAFQLVVNYTPPTWPTQDVPQQFHLDLEVADLDEGEEFAVSLGARPVPRSGVEGSFRVYLDPSGHPFCLCKSS